MTGAPRRGSQHWRRSSLPRALQTSLHAMMASVLTWSKGKNNKRILYKKKNTQKLHADFTQYIQILDDLDVTRPRTAWMNLMKIFAEWFSRKKIIRKLYLPSGINLYNVHFINLAEIQCICKLDFSKVSWNGLYFNYRPFHKKRDSVQL